MTSWFQINLGDAMLACGEQVRIRQLFFSSLSHQANSVGMAAFTRHESEGRLHCEEKISFSPLSAAIAKALGAKACEKPSKEGGRL